MRQNIVSIAGGVARNPLVRLAQPVTATLEAVILMGRQMRTIIISNVGMHMIRMMRPKSVKCWVR